MNLFRFIPGYESAIYDTGREPAFVMMLAFIVTYIITRGYTRIARKTGWGSASFGGVHTHHMVFGLVIAFVSSAVMFGFLPKSEIVITLLALLFGVGASLVLDEFALIFHLEDVYWEKEGRKSVDAVVLGAAFGTLFLLRTVPFSVEANQPAWMLVAAITLNICFATIAAAKGKIYIAIFGIFIPVLAFIGAIRLAEPESLWARKLYTNSPKKLNESKARYASMRKKWFARKEYVWDIIGGKIGRPPTQKK